ncbi:MAG: galactosyltransferase-related protein [Candidatus Pseudobacter hemicellulosilyticus]|uniref:Galactosyltransferase-related protein n=1 Tax=Candidatus Pseudobacter hemicellulosilyticus TaxID=3121375 RepID=A0AAJ6BET2_9BACT|nr:MAG: galactosyltransferase-related protein [Pseudobacter sp.]
MQKRIDLSDTSFVIPVRIDSADRIDNLTVIVSYLNTYFDTTIIILESDKEPRVKELTPGSYEYIFIESTAPLFDRTSNNNRLLNACNTPIAVLYDADVIIPPDQLLKAIEGIRKKSWHFSLPYDGRFIQVDKYCRQLFKKTLRLDFLQEAEWLFETSTWNSVGGCFVCQLAEYKKNGMENESIEGWGHDDAERVKRLRKLGYYINRSSGPLYHLCHSRSNNSYFFDQARAAASFGTYFNICSSSRQAVQQEIKQWEQKRSLYDRHQ